MRVLRTLDVRERPVSSVVTIGNFDGVHLGHKRIIGRVKELSKEIYGQAVLITFDPHPVSVLRAEGVRIITPLPLKMGLLEKEGIDLLLLLPFDETTRLMEPEAFVKILVERLCMRAIVVGSDFRFGRERRGDVSMLTQLATNLGFRLVLVENVEIEGERVGSQRIRQMLAEGEVRRARRFLGRPYEIYGRVVKGRKREIGFKTANIFTDFDIIPRDGVYITELAVGSQRFESVTNIGKNPTFGEDSLSIETHILDFSGDLYDREVGLFFLDRIRDEIAFEDVSSLKAQIETDIEVARAYFRGLKDSLGLLYN
jgi:riboflavin kinase/FMN adenylyltransferase